MNKELIKFCDIINDFVTIQIRPTSNSVQSSGMTYPVKLPDSYTCDCKKLSVCGKCKIAETEFMELRKQGFVFVD